MATYCIGDVHGCLLQLEGLLNTINYGSSDHLWFTGDLVGRGPNSLEVLRLVSELANVKVVLGNHDLHLLSVYHGIVDIGASTFAEILQAPDATKLLAWLEQQPLMHYDEDYQCALVHAGIYPPWTLEQAQIYAQEIDFSISFNRKIELLRVMYGDLPNIWDETLCGETRHRFIINAFTRMRFCSNLGHLDFKNTGKISEASVGYLPWFNVVPRAATDVKIIFGHWAALAGETASSHAIAMDTGCAWGRHLTALRLEDSARFSYGI